MNAQLRQSLSNPWLASAVSFGPIFAFFLCAFAVLPKPLPGIEGITAMPWCAPLGGLAGAVAVFAGLTMVDKIGAGPMNGMIITANLIASLIIRSLRRHEHGILLLHSLHQLNADCAHRQMNSILALPF